MPVLRARLRVFVRCASLQPDSRDLTKPVTTTIPKKSHCLVWGLFSKGKLFFFKEFIRFTEHRAVAITGKQKSETATRIMLWTREISKKKKKKNRKKVFRDVLFYFILFFYWNHEKKTILNYNFCCFCQETKKDNSDFWNIFGRAAERQSCLSPLFWSMSSLLEETPTGKRDNKPEKNIFFNSILFIYFYFFFFAENISAVSCLLHAFHFHHSFVAFLSSK